MFKDETGAPIPPAKTAAANRRDSLMKKAAAELEAARPQITRLAQHRVALAYSIARKMGHVASTADGRKSVTAHLLTMPTFALQGLFDMHKASESHVAEEPNPETNDEDLMPALDGEVPPAEGGEVPPAEGGDGTPADPEMQDLAADNAAVVQDIAELEQDFSELQEAMPQGASVVDLSSILGEESFDDKSAQLPEEGAPEDQLPTAASRKKAEDETKELETVAPNGNLSDVVNPLETDDLVNALKSASKSIGSQKVYDLGEGLEAIGMAGQSYATPDTVVTKQPNQSVHNEAQGVGDTTRHEQKGGHLASAKPGATKLPTRPIGHVASANDGQVERLGALLSDFSRGSGLY